MCFTKKDKLKGKKTKDFLGISRIVDEYYAR